MTRCVVACSAVGFGGALDGLARRDRERRGHRRPPRGLLVEVANAGRGDKIEVGNSPRDSRLVVVRDDDAVNAMNRHELGDIGQRSVTRAGQDTGTDSGRHRDPGCQRAVGPSWQRSHAARLDFLSLMEIHQKVAARGAPASGAA